MIDSFRDIQKTAIDIFTKQNLSLAETYKQVQDKYLVASDYLVMKATYNAAVSLNLAVDVEDIKAMIKASGEILAPAMVADIAKNRHRIAQGGRRYKSR